MEVDDKIFSADVTQEDIRVVGVFDQNPPKQEHQQKPLSPEQPKELAAAISKSYAPNEYEYEDEYEDEYYIYSGF